MPKGGVNFATLVAKRVGNLIRLQTLVLFGGDRETLFFLTQI